MKRNFIIAALMIVAGVMMNGPAANAQDGAFGGVDVDGRVQPTLRRVRPRSTAIYAARNHYTPHPVYTYSNAGLLAGHTHAWNQAEQNVYSWHGGYQNWQWGTPTALVVPPTASYQSSYAWGVGQTRSTPIHHQFGRGNAAMIGGGADGSGFSRTPYWPQSTDQFGLYPVRAPW